MNCHLANISFALTLSLIGRHVGLPDLRMIGMKGLTSALSIHALKHRQLHRPDAADTIPQLLVNDLIEALACRKQRQELQVSLVADDVLQVVDVAVPIAASYGGADARVPDSDLLWHCKVQQLGCADERVVYCCLGVSPVSAGELVIRTASSLQRSHKTRQLLAVDAQYPRHPAVGHVRKTHDLFFSYVALAVEVAKQVRIRLEVGFAFQVSSQSHFV